tara:strand:- start:197 stop:439 length:243 start_codon:yes stop_codon:yes gene_type:complete
MEKMLGEIKMLLTEEQTKQYLIDMIEHYGKKEQDTLGSLSWARSEAEYRKNTYKDIKIALFGEDVDDENRNKNNSQTWVC